LCHPDARIAADEVHDPMMGTSEPVIPQYLVRVRNEVPVGEEQELDELHHRLVLGGQACRFRAVVQGGGVSVQTEIYVSHIDIFSLDRYCLSSRNEMIVRWSALWIHNVAQGTGSVPHQADFTSSSGAGYRPEAGVGANRPAGGTGMNRLPAASPAGY